MESPSSLAFNYQKTVRSIVKLKLKKNKRYAKSLFRIGLDSLQNVLFNSRTEAKYKQLQVFIDLLACA